MTITYTRQGDYNLPDLQLPEQDDREIGVWGERRRRYLKNHHRVLYYNLLTKCKLHDHLADINEDAAEMYDRLVKQLAAKEGITELLKAKDQMEWVERLAEFKVLYRTVVETLTRIAQAYSPHSTEEEITRFCTNFNSFLFGVYPFVYHTEKQLEAMKLADVPHDQTTIFDMAYECLLKLLP